MLRRLNYILFSLSALLAFCSFTGCSNSIKKPGTFIIWTDREEFVSYSELFNSLQNKTKAVIVYKQRLANSLPPAKDEVKPDLIVGSWLKNEQTRKNFRPIDSLLSQDSVDANTIYPSLLEYGRMAGQQYLLPVSFNLPLVIFSTKYTNQIPDKYALTIDQLRETSAKYNTKNKKEIYTKMGFAPSWDPEFLYEITKQFGPCFKEKGTSFTWDNESLAKTINYIKSWTTENNDSTSAEQDFQFKYLYTPKYRQIAAERTLFAYTTSDKLFNISFEQLGETDFRWLLINDNLSVGDNIVSMAVYSQARNPARAEEFIRWFFQEENQKLMLERSFKMQLDTSTFGIASGFSTIRSVNEHLFPTYYRNLLGNLPSIEKIKAPQSFPSRWESLKERVIYPYISSSIKTDSEKQPESMEILLNTWSKQFD